MSDTPEGSPPASRRRSSSRTQQTTFEFNFDSRNESDIDKIVPKLKGEVNRANWEHRFYMALKENNKAYIQEAIRQLAIIKVGGNADLVTDLVIRELAKERQYENTRLRADWQKEMDKWDTCNTRACNLMFSTLDPIPASLVDKVENAREAYKILQAEYGTPSWQPNFKRFKILCALQYKGNNPQDFVRRFKEALFEIYQRGSSLDANTTLNFFIRSIQNNPRCKVFIQALKPNLKDPNFMVEIYREFNLTEGSSKIAIGYNSIPSVHTTSSNSKDTNSSSSNFDKKKDAKKGYNKQSNNSNSSTQAQDQGSSIITDRHIPVDFLNEYDYHTVPTQCYDNTGFGNKKQVQPRPSSPFRYRFSTPLPTVEDNPEKHLDIPTNLPLDHIHPFILEEQAPEILPDPDTFLLPTDDKMASSFGRFMEAQREDTGAHFEVGGRGTLVESQPASRQVVNEDIPTDMNVHQAPFQHDQLPS
ncbi:hypothetical protein PDIDSM_3142 [Penicillium digitatum]|nr:hypothetical protein PDIDSM_3142 [Penicillium digitatum]